MPRIEPSNTVIRLVFCKKRKNGPMICCQVSVSGLKVYLWGSSVRLKSLSDLEVILLALLTQIMLMEFRCYENETKSHRSE